MQLERLVAEDVAAVTVPDREGGLAPPVARPAHLVDPRLYERYVRARTDPDLRTAADAFEELTRIDPEFALAFSGLSQTYLVFMGRGAMGGDEALPKVERAARRALALDPSLGEPHVSLSAVVAVRSGLDAATAELELAVDAQPSLALARSPRASRERVAREP